MNARLARHCRQILGCEIAAARELEQIRHGFTHFSLTIRPILCEVSVLLPHAAQPGQIWLQPQDALQAAIPVPVRKLLERI